MSEMMLPDVNDPVSGPFWERARQRRLAVQRCTSCGEFRVPPLSGCPNCLEQDAEWVDLRQTGSIWSYAVYHRALHPAFAAEIPYTVVVVDLDDGPRITGRLSRDSGAVQIGSRVEAAFDDISPEVTLVEWRLAEP